MSAESSSLQGHQFLENHGFNYGRNFYWISIGALFGFWIIMNIGFTCALKFSKAPRRFQTAISEKRLSKLQAKDDMLEISQESELPNVAPSYAPADTKHIDCFYWSSETGKNVLVASAQSNLKAVTLELGGKSPFIVCEDASIDEAVELAHEALFFNMGQCCCAGSHTYVHERVYDEFVEKAKARATNRVVGDPFREGTEQGPQDSSGQQCAIFNSSHHHITLMVLQRYP